MVYRCLLYSFDVRGAGMFDYEACFGGMLRTETNPLICNLCAWSLSAIPTEPV